jgi:hypothetical protein
MPIHLLARLTIAATCTSSAAAFDVTHVSRMTGVVASCCHSREFPRHDASPKQSQSSPAAAEAEVPPSLAKSQPAAQLEAGVQQGELEELGKQ